MIRNLLTRANTNLRNARSYIRHLASRGDVPEGPIAYFDVSDPRLERYFYCLVKFFDIAGYRIVLRFRPRLLLNLRNYNDLLYGIRGLKIAFSAPAEPGITITDRAGLAEKGSALLIDTDYLAKNKGPGGFVFPYSMHPLVYHTGTHENVAGMREGRRNIRLFSYFANLANYRRNEMETLFGKMDREKVAEAVLAYPDPEALEILSEQADLAKLGMEGLMLAVATDLRIPFEDWLPTLSRASFFIAAPGVLMPYCHNLIEAMAVGTIPIIEYPEMFDPPLTDGVNCLAFRGAEALTDRIRDALGMDEDRIKEMSDAAAAYYDRYFEPAAAVRRLEARLPELDRIYLLAGHLSVEKLKSSADRQSQ